MGAKETGGCILCPDGSDNCEYELRIGNKIDFTYFEQEDYRSQYVDSLELKFDKDWNWLMLVIEKLEKDYIIEIIGKECRIRKKHGPGGGHNPTIILQQQSTKIKSVYNAVLKCIMLKNKS